MKKLVNINDLVGKTISKASVEYEDGDSNYAKVVIETTDGSVAVVEGNVEYDRCGDVEGISMESHTHRSNLEYAFAKQMGLYSDEEIEAHEEAERKRQEERDRKAAYEKEQKRKLKEQAELEKLKELAEKFNLDVREKE